MTEKSSSTSLQRRRVTGPAMLVTAAFIGPGTVITASRAGAQFGCELLWAVLLASVGAILLQSLAARLGIETGAGLSEAIRSTFAGSRWLLPTLVLIILAIGVGNAAYQAGNLAGAVVGITELVGGAPGWWVTMMAGIVVCLIGLGRDRLLQRTLVTLVCVLSVAFLLTALSSSPSWSRIGTGLLVPTVSSDSLSLVVALIGTTIVPYNLFLHASRSAETWRDVPNREAVRSSQIDTIVAISLGGLVTASILVTASSVFFDQSPRLESPGQIAEQLRPTLGATSGVMFALGIFAAGLTSSITAPMATAYAICGCLGWPTGASSKSFRGIAISVVVIGCSIGLLFGKSPAALIIAAQITNGLLLPVVATIMLLVVRRQTHIMGRSLSPLAFISAWCVVGLISALGIWRMMSGFLRLL